MKRREAALTLALLLGLAPRLAPASELPPPSDGYLQVARKVTPSVWVLMEPSFQVQPIGNVVVIEQSDGLVLVDSGGSPGAGRRIVAKVRTISAKPVKAVIITHWHGDHTQGLSEILKAWPGARTIAARATQAHLRDPRTMNTPAALDPTANASMQRRIQSYIEFSRKMHAEATTPREAAGWAASERLFRQYALDMDGAITTPTAEAFDDHVDLPDATAPVRAQFLGRANTDGDAVVWLPRQRVLVTGDIVVAPFPFGFESYPTDWIETLNRLRAYPAKILIPGHGAPQQGWAYVDRVSRVLSEVRAEVAPLAEAGLDLNEVESRIDGEAQIHAFAGDDPWLARWVREDWVKPIVASVYKEAKGVPIVQDLGGG